MSHCPLHPKRLRFIPISSDPPIGRNKSSCGEGTIIARYKNIHAYVNWFLIKNATCIINKSEHLFPNKNHTTNQVLTIKISDSNFSFSQIT
jgi:hypothetical protein